MPHRFVLLDSLESLARGNLLVRFSTISCTQHLEGVPLISLVSDKLLREGWVEPIEQPVEDLVERICPIYFRISEDGRRVHREGKWRYQRMTIREKVLGRLGVI